MLRVSFCGRLDSIECLGISLRLRLFDVLGKLHVMRIPLRIISALFKPTPDGVGMEADLTEGNRLRMPLADVLNDHLVQLLGVGADARCHHSTSSFAGRQRASFGVATYRSSSRVTNPSARQRSRNSREEWRVTGVPRNALGMRSWHIARNSRAVTPPTRVDCT